MSNDSTSVDVEEIQFIIDGEVVTIFHWVMFGVLCQMIDIFGIVTNIISIVCFVKQGFKDPINVSFLGLSVSDLGSLVTVIWANVCLTPPVSTADLPFNVIESAYLISGMPRAAFTRVTGWITAFITLERCLCIALPLKVKGLVTTKRVSIIIVCIFVVLIPSGAPVYVVNKMEMKFVPERNRTLLGLVYTEDREGVETVSFIINNVFVPFTAFVVVTVCTITLVVHLQIQTKWRKYSTPCAQSDIVSIRNRKVAKTVVMISIIFIISFIPISVSFMAMSLEPGFSVGGKYWDILTIIGGLGFFLESINSSVNIFFYYQMSSKYRHICHQLFCKQKKELHE